MTEFMPRLAGLVPDALAPRRYRVVLEDVELMVDIGFHDFEVGSPQRLLVTIEVDLDAAAFADGDEVGSAWNYDALRVIVHDVVAGRRFNLQETVVRTIYERVAARAGVKALSVTARKPDVYPDARAVGVTLASF
jgi:dihydroneopterin aldolase